MRSTDQISLRDSKSQADSLLQPEVSSTANDPLLNPVSLSVNPSNSTSVSQTSSHVASHSVPVEAELETLADPKPSVVLSLEQQHVLKRVISGHSVFFTGSAGLTKVSVNVRKILISIRDWEISTATRNYFRTGEKRVARRPTSYHGIYGDSGCQYWWQNTPFMGRNWTWRSGCRPIYRQVFW